MPTRRGSIEHARAGNPARGVLQIGQQLLAPLSAPPAALAARFSPAEAILVTWGETPSALAWSIQTFGVQQVR